MLDLKRVLAAKPKDKPIEELAPLSTVWGEEVFAKANAQEAELLVSGAAASRAIAPSVSFPGAQEAGASFVPRGEHPTPQFMRDSFQSLNGWWQCAFLPFEYDVLEDPSGLLSKLEVPADDTDCWQSILVPFSPEADLSGVQRQLGPQEVLWYVRNFDVPAPRNGERVMLHFQGVDDACAVWVNGRLQGTHCGGYLPFSFDITEALHEGENQLALAVADPSEQGIQLRGKQKINRSDLWYTAQSGIWKSVWLEVVPRHYLRSVKQTITFSDDLTQARVLLEARVCGVGTFCAEIYDTPYGEAQRVNGAPLVAGSAATKGSECVYANSTDVAVADGAVADGAVVCDEVVAWDSAAKAVVGEEDTCAQADAEEQMVKLELTIAHPHLWSPDDPYLYSVVYRFGPQAADGGAIDEVRSYLALRNACVKESPTGTRFFLNNKPLFLKGVLDQGYWPESHMTPPADAALVFDIQQMKQLGFNMLRKHIKIEDERWYYHCDRLGMLVWQDMVTGGGAYQEMQTMYIPTLFKASWGFFSDKNASFQQKIGADHPRYQKIWKETAQGTFDLLYNHPCIVTWVLFNEGWGQFDAVQATKEARAWDATRPIESVSGWFDQGVGDYYGVHNYFRDMVVFPDKMGCRASVDPIGAVCHRKRACVTCEFGGLVHNVAGHAQQTRSFGYDVYDNLSSLKQAVTSLISQMDALETQGLAGYVYTQVSDIEEETNGLLTYDRKVNKLADEMQLIGEM